MSWQFEMDSRDLAESPGLGSESQVPEAVADVGRHESLITPEVKNTLGSGCYPPGGFSVWVAAGFWGCTQNLRGKETVHRPLL